MLIILVCQDLINVPAVSTRTSLLPGFGCGLALAYDDLRFVAVFGSASARVTAHQVTGSQQATTSPKTPAATSQPSDGQWDCNFISGCRSVVGHAGIWGMSPMATVCICGEAAATSLEWAAARESSSDKTLTRRIAAGDQSAMRALFARYRVMVYRWLLRLVDDEALAENLLSEVFLDVWRHAGSFEARSSVSTWLLAIARYKALSARRRRTHAELDAATVPTLPYTPHDPPLT